MDIDRFIERNAPRWDRFDALLRRTGRRANRLSGAQVQELVSGYEAVCTDLSYARTAFGDEALVTRLTTLAARGAAVVYGTRPATFRAAARFVADAFPAALRTARPAIAVSAALLAVPALGVGMWLSLDARALEQLAPEAVREAYVSRDFAAYYTAQPSGQFGAVVATNNIRVGLLAFATGIAACVPTAAVLALNGANIGVAAALFVTAGQPWAFFSLILPHGLLELSAVVVAGATGLRLGWTLIAPGDRPRSAALAEEGRRAVVVAAGLVVVFAVAAAIEGYVTASRLPAWAEIGIGVAAEAAFVTYAVVRGRATARRGLTGALGEESGAPVPGVTPPRSPQRLAGA